MCVSFQNLCAFNDISFIFRRLLLYIAQKIISSQLVINHAVYCAFSVVCPLVDRMEDDTILPDTAITLEPNPSGNPNDVRPTGPGWITTGPNDRVATIITGDLTPGGQVQLDSPKNVKEFTVELIKPAQVIYVRLLSEILSLLSISIGFKFNALHLFILLKCHLSYQYLKTAMLFKTFIFFMKNMLFS